MQYSVLRLGYLLLHVWRLVCASSKDDRICCRIVHGDVKKCPLILRYFTVMYFLLMSRNVVWLFPAALALLVMAQLDLFGFFRCFFSGSARLVHVKKRLLVFCFVLNMFFCCRCSGFSDAVPNRIRFSVLHFVVIFLPWTVLLRDDIVSLPSVVPQDMFAVRSLNLFCVVTD